MQAIKQYQSMLRNLYATLSETVHSIYHYRSLSGKLGFSNLKSYMSYFTLNCNIEMIELKQ